MGSMLVGRLQRLEDKNFTSMLDRKRVHTFDAAVTTAIVAIVLDDVQEMSSSRKIENSLLQSNSIG